MNQSIPEKATCLGCGYRLINLPSPTCPECGRKFDPQNPPTFHCGTNWTTRRLVKITTTGCLAVLAIGLLARYVYRHIEIHQITEICVDCATISKREEITINGFTLYEKQLPCKQPAIVAILLPTDRVNGHSHTWKTMEARRFDWNRKRLKPDLVPGEPQFWGIQWKVGPLERILELQKEIPQLPSMIRNDILHETIAVNSMDGICLLIEMCEATDSGAIQKYLHEWKLMNRWKSYERMWERKRY